MTSEDSARTPIAYLNGSFLSFAEARLPVYDLGIVQGATVTERLRTVRHVPYLLDEHLSRLDRSLEKVGWSVDISRDAWRDIVEHVTAHNSSLIPTGNDLSVVIFVTAGQAILDSNGLVGESRPTVCVHTSPLPHSRWLPGYAHGIDVVTPSVRQIPRECVDPSIKMRSRMHWHLADKEATSTIPGAMALLLDFNGFVTETSSGNLFVVRSNELLTPSRERTLSGISQQHVEKLAESAGWQVRNMDMTADDVAAADEAFLTSSTYCILPVARIDGRSIGHDVPGPLTRQLSDAWSADMGLNFIEQCRACG